MGRKVAVVLGRDRDAGLNGMVRIKEEHSSDYTQDSDYKKYLAMCLALKHEISTEISL